MPSVIRKSAIIPTEHAPIQRAAQAPGQDSAEDVRQLGHRVLVQLLDPSQGRTLPERGPFLAVVVIIYLLVLIRLTLYRYWGNTACREWDEAPAPLIRR